MGLMGLVVLAHEHSEEDRAAQRRAHSGFTMQGHTAYGILSVVEKLPLKIESLDVWGISRAPNCLNFCRALSFF